MTSSKLAANPHDSVAAVAKNDDRDPKESTFPCKVCGRHFIKSSLVKHEPACKKLTKMQRKIFDSGKQRAQNSDIPLTSVRKAAKEKEKMGGTFPRPKTHWRERHQEFIGAVSASRQVEHALKTGAPLPPPPKTSFNPDYVRCDYCGRTFNQTAAERHVPFCREKNGRSKVITTRSNSVGRAPTSKSNGSRSSSRRQSREPPVPLERTPSVTKSSHQRTTTKSPANGRVPTGMNGRADQKINSATHHRTSALPTPVKRSRSAPRTTTAASRSSTATSKSGKSESTTPRPSNAPRTASKPKTPKPPSTAPKTPQKAPKSPSTTPKTAQKRSKTPQDSLKTPKSRSKTRSPLPDIKNIQGFAIAAPRTKSRSKSRSENRENVKNQKPKMDIERIPTRNGSVKKNKK